MWCAVREAPLREKPAALGCREFVGAAGELKNRRRPPPRGAVSEGAWQKLFVVEKTATERQARARLLISGHGPSVATREAA
jgi:hypothetical protein